MASAPRWCTVDGGEVAHRMSRLNKDSWRAACWRDRCVSPKFLHPRAGEPLCKRCQQKVGDSDGCA